MFNHTRIVQTSLLAALAFCSLAAARAGRSQAPPPGGVADLSLFTNIGSALAGVCAATDKPCPRVVLDTHAIEPIAMIDGSVNLSSDLADQARSTAENVALAALLVA